MASKTFYECGCMEQGDQFFHCDLHKPSNPHEQTPAADPREKALRDIALGVDYYVKHNDPRTLLLIIQRNIEELLATERQQHAAQLAEAEQRVEAAEQALAALRQQLAEIDQIIYMPTDAIPHAEGRQAFRRGWLTSAAAAAETHEAERDAFQHTIQTLRAELDAGNEAWRLLDMIDAEFQSDDACVWAFGRCVEDRVNACIERRKAQERRGGVPPLLTEGSRKADSPHE